MQLDAQTNQSLHCLGLLKWSVYVTCMLLLFNLHASKN